MPDGLRLPCCVDTNAVADHVTACFLEKIDGIADGQDGFHGIVGNFEAELTFEFDHQFDQIQTIGPEVIDEARAVHHLVGIDKQLLNHDRPGAFGNVEHRAMPPRSIVTSSQERPALVPNRQTAHGELDPPVGKLPPAFDDFPVAALRNIGDDVTDL